MPAVPTCILGFEEGTGTVAADSSRFLNHGTLQNGAGWATGKIGGGAVSLDGVDDQVLLATAGALGISNVGAFSFSAWVYPTAFTDYNQIFSLWGVGVNDRIELGLSGAGVGSNNDLIFCMAKNTIYTSVNANTNEDLLALNTWGHVAAVFDGSLTGDANRMKLYFNGTQRTLAFATTGVGTATLSADSTNCYLGRRGATGNSPWAGRIDQAIIEPRAWSAAEISWLFNNGNGRINPVQSSGGGLYGSLYGDLDLYS